MPDIATLTEFLEATGARLNAYDMGRRVDPISRETLLAFERTDRPYPLPLQQQAWLGLLIQDRNHKTEPAIWFIRFPLDEQGKLVLAARDDFMHQLVERLGSTLQASKQDERMQAALEDNPYAFHPKPERMAVFHAKVTALLKQPASRYYEHARAYFSGELGWEQWSFLGYQGIADLAARLDQDGNDHLLSAAIPQLPPPALEALCHCLENERITVEIARELLSRTQEALSGPEPNPRILTACIRGISHGVSHNLKQAMMQAILSHQVSRRSDILAAICGRAWERLLDEETRDQYLQRLADNDQGQPFFNNILSDLLFLPDTREALLSSLRKENRPANLGSAIGEFFNTIKQQ
ncbi:MAG: DUF3549 family protein [Pseudomonadota bacterium]